MWKRKFIFTVLLAIIYSSVYADSFNYKTDFKILKDDGVNKTLYYHNNEKNYDVTIFYSEAYKDARVIIKHNMVSSVSDETDVELESMFAYYTTLLLGYTRKPDITDRKKFNNPARYTYHLYFWGK